MMDSLENALEQAQTEETKVEEVVNEAASEVENVPAEEPQKEETATQEPTVEAPAEVEEAPVAETEAPAEEAEAPVVEETVAEASVEEEPAKEEEVAAEEEAGQDEEPKKVYKTKHEILERVKEIAHGDENPVKEEVDHLKTLFYKLHIAERDAKQKEYLDAGGDPEKFVVLPDEEEEAFKAEMGIIKEKRAKLFMEQEAEKQENLKRKLNIIEQIKTMVTSPEEANKSYQDFKKLQAEWKEIKAVPAEKANELWRNYQLYVEQFYDLLKLNSEAREYDFRKNLEAKTLLCEQAEKLADEKDVVAAINRLQTLHQEWKEIGPVAKELREEIWNRFKEASTVIRKRHQEFFEARKAKEEENLTKKTELCEQVEAVSTEGLKTFADWDAKTKEIIDLQAIWKTIGFAPQKVNTQIFERFRAACDKFFGEKAAYFKSVKEELNQNLAKKRALVEQAEALKESTDWKQTGDALIELQKQWKSIGAVPRKVSDELWKRFVGACDHFFEAKSQATAGQREEEKENLAKKKDIIERLRALAEEGAEATAQKVHELQAEWANVGFVPIRDKDKVYKQYREVVDTLYKKLNLSQAERRLSSFRTTLKVSAEAGANTLARERDRLARAYEIMKGELQTYENNIGFLSASSKKGSTLVQEIEKKVEKLKDELNLLKEKIKAVEAEMRNQDKKEE